MTPPLRPQTLYNLLVRAEEQVSGNVAGDHTNVTSQVKSKTLDGAVKQEKPVSGFDLEACQNAVRLNPKDAFAHSCLGDVLYVQGKLDDAVLSYKKAIELNPKLAVAHNNLGFVLDTQGKSDDAVRAYKKAIKLDPRYITVNNNLGRILCGRGVLDSDVFARVYLRMSEFNNDYKIMSYDYSGNINPYELSFKVRECERVVELISHSANAHNSLGVALDMCGKSDDAVLALKKAVELNPKLGVAHNNLGIALDKQGNLDDAVLAFKQAVELKPDLGYKYYNLAIALKKQGKLDEAVLAYKKVIELNNNCLSAHQCIFAHYNLGVVLEAQGKLDEAVLEYKTAVEWCPNSYFVRHALTVALKKQGTLDDARKHYQSAAQLWGKHAIKAPKEINHASLEQKVETAGKSKPKRSSIRNALIGIAACAAIAAGGIFAYRASQRQDQENSAFAHLKWGYAIRELGTLDEAVSSYKRAIELDPKDAFVYTNLGLALNMQGKQDEALLAFKKVIELNPKDAEAYYHLGNMLGKQGKLDEARKHYQTAAQLGDKDAINALEGMNVAPVVHKKLDDIVDKQGKSDGVAVFSVEELADCYSVSGVQLRDGIYTVDFSKELLPIRTQEEHAEYALKAKPGEFRAASAPQIYAICKKLYKNKDGQHKLLVEKTRENLEGIMKTSQISTLSKVKYNPRNGDVVVHDYKQETEHRIKTTLVGTNGFITIPETEAKQYARALFGTDDSVEEINAVFKWITGKSVYAFRFNDKPRSTYERVVALGVHEDKRFYLNASSNTDYGPAFGVRLSQKNSTDLPESGGEK